MMSSETKRLVRLARGKINLIQSAAPGPEWAAAIGSALIAVDILGDKLEEAVSEVAHLRTNAVGPPDYMRLKVRAEEAERKLSEERARIVKMIEQVIDEYCDHACFTKPACDAGTKSGTACRIKHSLWYALRGPSD